VKSLILSLATARLTQLVVEDEITEPIRNAVDTAWRNTPDDTLPDRIWATLNEIINCGACTSVWAGAGILVAEQTGMGRFLVRVLALSQAALAVKAVIERIER
jgi:Protein of unknown function (DUF1360)